MADVTMPAEFEERVAMLRKLRSYLEAQKQRLADYLALLDQQADNVHGVDSVRLEAQVSEEQRLVREIFAIQKAVTPLRGLYQERYGEAETVLPELEEHLEQLKQQALQHNRRNRELLRDSMRRIQQEIRSLRVPKRPRNPYASEETATMIDIST